MSTHIPVDLSLVTAATTAPVTTNEALWSSCSSVQLQEKISALDATSSNCLSNAVTVDPVKSVGQQFPDEAQCNEHSGDCSRAAPGFEADCLNLRCQVGLLTETILYPRLDGSYCSASPGSNMWCEAGRCVASGTTLTPVDGGWGLWDCSPHQRCHGDCSACGFLGQYQVESNVRRCDSPYPNNAGANCIGSSVRGRLCSSVQCTSGQVDAGAYMASACAASSAGSTPSTIPSVDCLFACVHNSTVQGYISLPNGSPCGTNGLCVNDLCLTPKCSDLQLYVFDASDCAECATTTPEPSTITTRSPLTCGTGYAGDHMYTISTTNLIYSVRNHGYKIERVMGQVATSDVDALCNEHCIKKIYRLFNTAIRNHYYTIDLKKVEEATAVHGYFFDGDNHRPMDEGYCISSAACGATLPVHQFYNRIGTDHFYTTKESDVQTLKSDPFYEYEGIMCYIFP